ncbi:DUF3861 domain-containing protein [Ferrimonas balearica]|uniref:DUF3861 domain-containing protein n=1 Tax=Ferrimonas balearica TaxID=44012 RepID=UPI001C99D0E6|nr:DUF3861 domain-containing protein [Ferrimonas balearica]MBY5921101.1 DUF3861 domain-containing protein [Ferrimonas balearica]MBY5996214.1 DUF3861 domain-containing protein [Ferrimonas balearica]
MKGHLYQFTVEHQEDAKGQAVQQAPLEFQVRNHDDLFHIIERLEGKLGLDQQDTVAFAVGLKLFGEVMMKNRNVELFKAFKPHFTEFMKQLKRA